MITCAIVDDNPDILDRLEYLLKQVGGVKIVVKEHDPEKALEAICIQKPELVFTDVEMSPYSGFVLIEELRKRKINSHFVIVTAWDQYAIRAIKQQAFDYLVKPVDIDELKECINRFTGNQKRKFTSLAETKLTDNEKEIILHLAEGKTSQEVADELFRSIHTINSYRKKILEKLDSKSITEAISKAFM